MRRTVQRRQTRRWRLVVSNVRTRTARAWSAEEYMKLVSELSERRCYGPPAPASPIP